VIEGVPSKGLKGKRVSSKQDVLADWDPFFDADDLVP
jgi:hypothetical protein